MTTIATHITMHDIHGLLVAEIGRLAPPLIDGEDVQLVHLPGGRYATVLRLSSPDTLTVSKKVANTVDFERPGLAAFLMREHSKFIFGRFECVGEGDLMVEDSIFVDSAVAGEQIMRVVMAVHAIAVEAHKTLIDVGVIEADDDD